LLVRAPINKFRYVAKLDAPSLVLPSPLLQHLEVPDMLKELRHLPRSQRALEDLPFTKYLVKMATILRDHLQTNASDKAIQEDMVDVLLFMQGLSAVGDTSSLRSNSGPS
jgi:hypothetical protein